jgi:hypothetical protein
MERGQPVRCDLRQYFFESSDPAFRTSLGEIRDNQGMP